MYSITGMRCSKCFWYLSKDVEKVVGCMFLRRGLDGTTKMQNKSRHHLDGDSSYGYAFLETEEKICHIF